MNLNKLVERMNHMSLADEFVERRFIVFQCYKCQHPAMEITTKKALEDNSDGSTKFQIETTCPRCQATDQFVINNGQEGEISASVNSGKVAKVANIK